MVLLFLESLGTTELLVILVVALVLFGPRRLPEMARTFGKSLNEFKRASDEFKRTWEREVTVESVEREAAISRAMVPEITPSQFPPEERTAASLAADTATEIPTATNMMRAASVLPPDAYSIARGSQPAASPAPADTAEVAETAAEEPPVSRKTDWL